MKKILYVTNIEVPYRVKFFNELSKYCDLTVLYERKYSSNRDEKWSNSVEGNYKKEYLNGKNVGTEFSFSFSIVKYLFGGYDKIIFGCFNSPVQIFATTILRLLRRSYVMSTDGELFLNGKSLKTKTKCFFLRGATRYLIAGEKSAMNVKKIVNENKVYTYYFSSLNEKELETHANAGLSANRNKTVLIIGQYFDYKGLDIAMDVARLDETIEYICVGMGKRTEKFVSEQKVKDLKNVKVISFLNKDELEKLYLTCGILLLPTKQECWGLVVNEAASFGMPIVSTWGSGAAVEFLSDSYPEYLAEPGNPQDLYEKVVKALKTSNSKLESDLVVKSRKYSIESNVRTYLEVLNIH